METGLSVNKYIYDILSRSEILNKKVGRKIYPIIAEENTTFPFVLFKKDNVNPNYTKDIPTFDEVEFSVAAISLNYSETVEIAEEIRNCLECIKTNYFKQVRFVSISEDYIDDCYVQELRFKATI